MAPYIRSTYRLSRIRDWPQLEEGILDLILQKFPHLNCLNFGKVCTRWRAVFHYRRTISRPPPCILLRSTRGGCNLHRGIIHGGKILRLFSPNPNLLTFHGIVGSGFGWLVIACLFSSDIYLLNPASNERFPLPSLGPVYLRHVDMSSNPGSGNYVPVARIRYRGLVHGLALWSPGEQGWTITYIQQILKQCVDSVVQDGKLYLLCNNGDIVVCTFNPQTKVTAQLWTYNFVSINDMQFKRLVRSNGDLFLVLRQAVGSLMQVFRKRAEHEGPWEMMESLGDLVLLIGIHGAESVSAMDMMGPTYDSNSIYCLAFNQSLHKYSITDMRTDNIRIDEPSLEWVVTQTWLRVLSKHGEKLMRYPNNFRIWRRTNL